MKSTLSLVLAVAAFLPVSAAAGGGSFFGPGGGGGSSSTGTLVDGADASLRNVTVQTLQSTGTAPSLTATGAVIAAGSSFTVTGKSLFRGNVGLGTSVLDPDFAIDMGPDASTSKRWALYSDNAGGSFYGFGLHASGYVETWRNNDLVMSVGAGLVGIGSPSAGVAPNAALEVNRTGGDILTATNAGATILAVHAGSSVTVTGNQTVTGNLGIGTASPSKKLHVSSGTLMVDGSGGDISVNGIVLTESSGKLGIGDATPGAYLTLAPGTGPRLLMYNAAPVHVGFGIDVSASNALDIMAHGSGAAGKINLGQFGTGADVTTGHVVYVGMEANGGWRLYSRTIAQLMAITPVAVGETFYCNNCSPVKAVISTGTSAGNFASIDGGAFQ